MKASSWSLATSCSSPKRNISTLRTACAKAIKQNIIIIITMGVMSRPAGGAPAFTEHMYSKSPVCVH